MYFLFFRERRGREKKGEKHQCARGKLIGCLSHAPYWGPGPQPRHVPWLGTRVVTLWFIGWHSIHSATPARTLVIIFKKQYKFGLRGPESGEDRAGRAGKRSSLGCITPFPICPRPPPELEPACSGCRDVQDSEQRF